MLSENRAFRADLYHIFEANDIHRLLMGKTELIFLLGTNLDFRVGYLFFTTILLSTRVEILTALNLIDDFSFGFVSVRVFFAMNLGDFEAFIFEAGCVAD